MGRGQLIVVMDEPMVVRTPLDRTWPAVGFGE
jgi:hypothetical protein